MDMGEIKKVYIYSEAHTNYHEMHAKMQHLIKGEILYPSPTILAMHFIVVKSLIEKKIAPMTMFTNKQ